VLQELISGNWDQDADYLLYMADQWLRGSPPWINEFDDKLPLTNVLFLLPAIFSSIRVYQLESAVLILLGAGCAGLVFRRIAYPSWTNSTVKATAFALLVGCVYAYSLAFIGSSLTSINPPSASLLMMAMFVVFYPYGNSIKSQRKSSLAWLCCASLLVAIAISIRPYFLLPGLLLMTWYNARISVDHVRTRSILIASMVWIGMIGVSLFLVNALPYLLGGHEEAFISGIKILSQRLIPSALNEMLKRQIRDLLTLPNLAFLAFGSTIILAPLYAFIQKSKQYSFNFLGWSAKIDVLFLTLFPMLLEWIILKKHYYPHYLQLFVPFVCLAFGLLCLMLDELFRIQTRVSNRALSLLVTIVALLALTRVDVFTAIDAFARRQLDWRTAEYISIIKDKDALKLLDRGFIYPESMSLHWKLGQARHGFPNSFSTILIDRGAWKGLEMPVYFGLPITTGQYCRRLIDKGPPVIITKTDWIRDCLDKDASRRYMKQSGVDHALIDLAANAEMQPPYSLDFYARQ
jgi:hypothetical protein